MLGPALPVSFPTPPSVDGDTYSYVDIKQFSIKQFSAAPLMMLTIVSSHPVPYIALLMIRCYPELKSTTRTTVGGYHLRKHKHSFILVPLVWPNATSQTMIIQE